MGKETTVDNIGKFDRAFWIEKGRLLLSNGFLVDIENQVCFEYIHSHNKTIDYWAPYGGPSGHFSLLDQQVYIARKETKTHWNLDRLAVGKDFGRSCAMAALRMTDQLAILDPEECDPGQLFLISTTQYRIINVGKVRETESMMLVEQPDGNLVVFNREGNIFYFDRFICEGSEKRIYNQIH